MTSKLNISLKHSHKTFGGGKAFTLKTMTSYMSSMTEYATRSHEYDGYVNPNADSMSLKASVLIAQMILHHFYKKASTSEINRLFWDVGCLLGCDGSASCRHSYYVLNFIMKHIHKYNRKTSADLCDSMNFFIKQSEENRFLSYGSPKPYSIDSHI